MLQALIVDGAVLIFSRIFEGVFQFQNIASRSDLVSTLNEMASSIRTN
jgi:hypothetical protein